MSDQAKKLTLRTKDWDGTFQMIDWWEIEATRKAKIMVVGAGALGNEVLKNLALLNIGNILVVDFDTIEYSNLCRSVLFREKDIGSTKAEIAAQRIKDLNPNVGVKTIEGDIMLDVGLGVFRRMDAVIGCLDNRLARLYINRHCHKVNKTWVDGAIENLAGQLCVYEPDTSCYECQLSVHDWANIQSKIGCPDIAMRNTSQGRIPTTPISSSIIAAMMVQEALKVIHNNEKQLSSGQKFYYEGLNNIAEWFPFGQLKEDCESHFLYEDIVEIDKLTSNSTLEEAIKAIASTLDVEEQKVEIELDYEVVLELTTRTNEISSEVIIPQPHLSEAIINQYREIPGEQVIITHAVSRLGSTFPNVKTKLTELGVPPLQILRVQVDDETHFVELTGDTEFLQFT